MEEEIISRDADNDRQPYRDQTLRARLSASAAEMFGQNYLTGECVIKNPRRFAVVDPCRGGPGRGRNADRGFGSLFANQRN